MELRVVSHYTTLSEIQSWWEVPNIAHFCKLFHATFNLLDFEIEELEEALLTDGTAKSLWLQELIMRLLSGCLPKKEITTLNYQKYLRILFRWKCLDNQYNPFNTDVDFHLLPVRTKVDILHALCDYRLDDELGQLKDVKVDDLRVKPLGHDSYDSAYWYFSGTRVYREDFKTHYRKSGWRVVCFTEKDWLQLSKMFEKSTSKCERMLYCILKEKFLPQLPTLFRRKKRLYYKRRLQRKLSQVTQRKKKPQPKKNKLKSPLNRSI